MKMNKLSNVINLADEINKRNKNGDYKLICEFEDENTSLRAYINTQTKSVKITQTDNDLYVTSVVLSKQETLDFISSIAKSLNK